jgi:hypothetical protein
MKDNKIKKSDIKNTDMLGFPNIIHVAETMKQNYSRVPRIPLKRFRVV